MKQLSFLFLLACSLFSAQQNLLDNALNENNLSANVKLSAEMVKTYHSTAYYNVSITNLEQNFRIKLPNGKTIAATFLKNYKYSNQSTSAAYKIENEPGAELVLSEYNKVVTGMYASAAGEKYIFHQTAPSVMAVSLVNEQQLIAQDSEDDTAATPPEIIGLKNTLANANVCSLESVCGNSVVDVMVLYTPQAKTAFGGAAQSNSSITTAITNFNVALNNAGVTNVTINLVYSGEVAYADSGDINSDLTRLRTAGDGFLDDVQSLRTLYGADLVALVTASPTSTCGLGYVNTNATNYSPTLAYTVTLFNCVVSNYSLAHEMGHNMGLNHDWYVSSSTTPCNHHHGYTNRTAITGGTASPASARWRTIMAYNNECSAAGISCTRRNLWSNPTVNYNGEATGIAIGNAQPSHESYGFARFACVVSQFSPTASLSTKENAIENFSVYPNPVKDVVYVQGPRKAGYTFTLINAEGRGLQSTTATTISVKEYTSGVYYLVIYDKNNQLIGTKKLIIE